MRRRWLSLGWCLFAACTHVPAQDGDAGAPFDSGLDAGIDSGVPVGAVLTIGSVPLGPVNRLLLGSGTQWTANGDGLVDSSGQAVPVVANAVARLAPPLMRYPGGTLADGFSFPNSIQPLATRPPGFDLLGKSQPMPLGPQEFLQVCKQLGATPLFTVNVFSAPVDDAVAWVHFAQDAGAQGFPVATYWEIGNEPYLNTTVYADGGVDTLTPADYAARANLFLSQMRAADPTLKFSIPIHEDSLNGVPIVTKPGYLDTVLAQVTQPFDLVSVHDGYLPADFNHTATPAELYLATVAGPVELGEVLDAYRARLDAAFPGRSIRFALTEWHPWLTEDFVVLILTNPNPTVQQILAAVDADEQANSLAGAIYVADVLRVLSYRSDVELATLHSASENYIFGAVTSAGILLRPALVLEAASQVLKGELLSASVSGAPTLSTPSVGLVHAFSSIPAVGALAAQDSGVVHILVFNKDPANPVTLQIVSASGAYSSLQARALVDADPLAHSETAELAWTPLAVDGGVISLPPHSVARVDAQ